MLHREVFILALSAALDSIYAHPKEIATLKTQDMEKFLREEVAGEHHTIEKSVGKFRFEIKRYATDKPFEYFVTYKG